MSEKIAVIGLGYVGLPLAVALSRHYPVIGFDIDLSRIQELKEAQDRTGEVDSASLAAAHLTLTSDLHSLKDYDLYIVTVPTPIDAQNKPDLSAVMRASETIGSVMNKDAIVVYESTVYPGVTEDICGPILEKVSGLKCGEDFYLGYSPERINPGDKVHTIDQITKVVSGQTGEVTDKLAHIYGSINSNNIFKAVDIKTAEAAKVIENAQRDINIAFMNEVACIFERLDISIYDVLEAAKTKWNFLPFTPGLVGGHCVGVDPFYLAECAKSMGLNPEVILSGRRINDAMGGVIARNIHERVIHLGTYGQRAKILVLGMTFKENVPDLRNTKVVDIIQSLDNYGHEVLVHDVLANPKEAEKLYNVHLLTTMDALGVDRREAIGQSQSSANFGQQYDCIVAAVAHDAYKQLSTKEIQRLLKPGGLVVDIKRIWQRVDLPEDMHYWTL